MSESTLEAPPIREPAIPDQAPPAEPVPALDVTRKVARMSLHQTPATRLGPPGDQTDLLRRVLDDATVAREVLRGAALAR